MKPLLICLAFTLIPVGVFAHWITYSRSGTTGEIAGYDSLTCSFAKSVAKNSIENGVKFGYKVGSYRISSCRTRPTGYSLPSGQRQYFFRATWNATYIPSDYHQKKHRDGWTCHPPRGNSC